MERFKGLSGKYYVENSFGKGKYDYAVYENEDAYQNRKHLPSYVSSQIAFEDYKETKVKEVYVFEIDIDNKKQTVITNTMGMMEQGIEGESKFKNYLRLLQEKHGRENVTYNLKRESICITTNLEQ